MSSSNITKADVRFAVPALFVVHRLALDAPQTFLALGSPLDARQCVTTTRNNVKSLYGRFSSSRWRHLSIKFHEGKFISQLFCGVAGTEICIVIAKRTFTVPLEAAVAAYQQGRGDAERGLFPAHLAEAADMFRLSAYLLHVEEVVHLSTFLEDLSKFNRHLDDITKEEEAVPADDNASFVLRMLPYVRERTRLEEIRDAVMLALGEVVPQKKEEVKDEPGSGEEVDEHEEGCDVVVADASLVKNEEEVEEEEEELPGTGVDVVVTDARNEDEFDVKIVHPRYRAENIAIFGPVEHWKDDELDLAQYAPVSAEPAEAADQPCSSASLQKPEAEKKPKQPWWKRQRGDDHSDCSNLSDEDEQQPRPAVAIEGIHAFHQTCLERYPPSEEQMEQREERRAEYKAWMDRQCEAITQEACNEFAENLAAFARSRKPVRQDQEADPEDTEVPDQEADAVPAVIAVPTAVTEEECAKSTTACRGLTGNPVSGNRAHAFCVPLKLALLDKVKHNFTCKKCKAEQKAKADREAKAAVKKAASDDEGDAPSKKKGKGGHRKKL